MPQICSLLGIYCIYCKNQSDKKFATVLYVLYLEFFVSFSFYHDCEGLILFLVCTPVKSEIIIVTCLS